MQAGLWRPLADRCFSLAGQQRSIGEKPFNGSSPQTQSRQVVPNMLSARMASRCHLGPSEESGLRQGMALATPAFNLRSGRNNGALPARKVAAMSAGVLPFRSFPLTVGSRPGKYRHPFLPGVDGLPTCPLTLNAFSASTIYETLVCWARLQAAMSVGRRAKVYQDTFGPRYGQVAGLLLTVM